MVASIHLTTIILDHNLVVYRANPLRSHITCLRDILAIPMLDLEQKLVENKLL